MKSMRGQKYYTPMEAAKLGLIQNGRGDKGTVAGHYRFVIQLIKSGRIKAKTYNAAGSKPYWLIPESEITRYHEFV